MKFKNIVEIKYKCTDTNIKTLFLHDHIIKQNEYLNNIFALFNDENITVTVDCVEKEFEFVLDVMTSNVDVDLINLDNYLNLLKISSFFLVDIKEHKNIISKITKCCDQDTDDTRIEKILDMLMNFDVDADIIKKILVKNYHKILRFSPKYNLYLKSYEIQNNDFKFFVPVKKMETSVPAGDYVKTNFFQLESPTIIFVNDTEFLFAKSDCYNCDITPQTTYEISVSADDYPNVYTTCRIKTMNNNYILQLLFINNVNWVRVAKYT